MKLDTRDIIAVANNRYMRRAGNKLTLLMVAVIVVGFGGAFFTAPSALKWGLCVVAAVCVIFVVWAMDKGQKRERQRLLAEWDREKLMEEGYKRERDAENKGKA